MTTRSHMIPREILAQHTAVLGKTGSGKTSTAKLLIEQVVAEGARVCVLDPIKSDWWGLTSSRDGKKAGLPFHILGGPRGHVPLHASAGKVIGEIVANGALPLSIIDMADFEPGGQAKFFTEFAPTLLRKMRGVVYLVIEEAHLFAPKERSGIGAENLSIHWAKTLATAGRSKGVRLVLVTQRTQALHNALLGSCDTMIVHRLTAPADQEPVIKWLKSNVRDEEIRDQVTNEMSSLKTGTGWLCSSEAKIFKLVDFPRIHTYDNTATPTGDGDIREIKTAPVDQEKLRAIIGAEIEKAKADDPRELRKEIARLRGEIAKVPGAAVVTAKTVDKAVLTDADRALLGKLADVLKEQEFVFGARKEAVVTGVALALAQLTERFTQQLAAALDTHVAAAVKSIESKGFQKILAKLSVLSPEPSAHDSRRPAAPRAEPPGRSSAATRPTETRAPRGADRSGAAGDLDGAQQKILDVVAMLGVRAIDVNRESVARWLDIHPNGGRYGSNLAHLRAEGYLDGFRLTDKGAAAAHCLETGLVAAREPLDGAQRQIVDVLERADGIKFTRETLAAELGIHPNGGRYGSNLARLRTMGIIPERGDIYLTDGARA